MRSDKQFPLFFLAVLCVISLASPALSFDLIIPDTGQDLCYDWEYIICDEWHMEGPNQICDTTPYCPNPGEDFYGQDAIYTINPPDLTDNFDGTVTDNLTGLVWEQKTAETEQYSFTTYSEAASYCEGLSLGGNDDWRVPTRREFSTLLNHSRTSPSLDVTYFPDYTYNGPNEVYYWTSSVYHDDPAQMWKVQISFGIMEAVIPQSPPHKVRCVSGATEPEADYTDNGNGTITDNVTGLMWEQKTDDGGSRDKDNTATWNDALAYCEDLVLGSYSDWRLPNPKELERIVDPSTSNPAVDTTSFPNTNSGFYWTGTTCVGCHKHKAYAYDFSDGKLYFGLKKDVNGDGSYHEHYTRCVRHYNPCEGDFDCDGDQDGTDAAGFKVHFGRSGFNNPCTYDNPCYGDFDEDGDADGTDAATFKGDFGRSGFSNPCPACDKPIGVLFVVHGGMTTFEPQYLWDAMVHQFSYDPNHSVYKFVIWNSSNWPLVLEMEYGARFFRMYEFEYDRIGGLDPFHGITDQQLLDIKADLDANEHGLTFEVDWSGYMTAAHPAQYAYPRFLYYGPDGPDVGNNLTYCAGEGEPGGPWLDCDPERYNVDGPVERMIKKGAYRIMVIDWTMGGPRFSKTFDVVEMSKRALEDWKTKYGVTVPLTWVNDYSNLMEESYPIEPEGWTRILKNPTVDSDVLLSGRPNPVVLDPVAVDLQVDAIEAGFSDVDDADTAVLLFNHALHDYNEWFDPKVNDTQIINEGIKEELLIRRPTMDPDNIIGCFGGIQEVNPENHDLEERNRPMRGESYGHAWLYQTEKVMPGGEWGYRYWDALEYLKNRGVQHIVISFPQVVVDNALNMVEVVNQVPAREIGYKNWLKWGTWDYDSYPGVGHPFPDYWGNWVNTDCGEWELNYDGGTALFSEKATLTGDSSGATGVIKWFSGDASSGTLVLKELTGTFLDDELITDDKGGSASASGVEIMTSDPECCFEMGGCGDPLRPYPPVRQTPYGTKMIDLDPHLCFDMSEYGHRGYDPAGVPPDPDNPVQDQYTGTWEMYSPPNDDPRVGEMLAQHVLDAIIKPMPYITNGDIEGISEGGSVTFDAHVETGGTSPYTYEWSTNKNDAGWVSQGAGSSWTFNTTGGDAGTYAVRCIVTDSLSETGEVIWEGFEVSTP